MLLSFGEPKLSTSDLLNRFKGLSTNIIRTQTLISTHRKQYEDLQDLVLELTRKEEVLDKVCELFRALIDKEMLGNIQSSQELLTEGLQYIFEDLDISVKARTTIQRGKVSVDFVTQQIHKDGLVTEGNTMDIYGGSVATVQSVLLRVVVVTRRGLRPLLLLDESLSAVAEHYVPRVGIFLRTLADKLGLDILVVTHNPTLIDEANVAYRIKNVNGTATFAKIQGSKQ